MKRYVSIVAVVFLFLSSAMLVHASGVEQNHVQKVLNENKTLEGFLASDEVLSFNEIASLTDSVIGSEAVMLNRMSDQELRALHLNADDIANIRQEALAFHKAHIQKVTSLDKTYEGFLKNDDVLSFEDIQVLNGGQSFSELDMLYALKKASKAELIQRGFTNSEMNQIKNHDVKTLYLERLSELSNPELLARGLSADNIQSLRAGKYQDVSEMALKKAAAEVAFGVFSDSGDSAGCHTILYWDWNKSPIFHHGVVNIYPFAGAEGRGQSVSKRVYKNQSAQVSDITCYELPLKTAENGCTFRVPMLQMTPESSMYDRAGKVFIVLTGENKATQE